MSAPALVGAALEVGLNRFLRLEPSALRRCGELRGSIRLEAIDLGWSFLIEPLGNGVRVDTDPETPARVTARAPAAKLLQLALRGAGGDGALPQGLDIDGDVDLLRRFARILVDVGFDPEELAAKLVGDTAAHRLTQGLRDAFGWARRSAESLAYSGAEYLREETGDLARAADVAEWMDAVDDLREATDRLQARLERIETAGDPT